MNRNEMVCLVPTRRSALREHAAHGAMLAGLDYLEVGPDRRTLAVTFIGRAPPGLTEKSFLVEGGRRVRGIRVTSVALQPGCEDDTLVLTLDAAGDFSRYTLRLVEDRDASPVRPAGVDARYDALTFSFEVDCPSELDVAVPRVCPAPSRPAPHLDYLAKDYASFQRLIFDRLSLVLPAWKERHAADQGVMLVELLAYVGDYLSYYQDAVATEAYLGTARQRISVRRHARLVDYAVHEGVNARAWVVLETDSDLEIRAGDLSLVTALGDRAPAAWKGAGTVLTWDDLRGVPSGTFEVFEPLEPRGDQVIRLRAAHSEIRFHTWGDEQCCLPRGATSATLVDEYELWSKGKMRRKLHLRAGDVLILEEVRGPRTDRPEDAEPSHRTAVRLTRVTPTEDPLHPVSVDGKDEFVPRPLLDVEWAPDDALPFPLCLSALATPECELIEVSVARGNVILVDHGRTVSEEIEEDVPQVASRPECEGRDRPGEIERVGGRFRPALNEGPLTFAEALPSWDTYSNQSFPPASVMLDQDPRLATPQVALTSRQTPRAGAGPCGEAPDPGSKKDSKEPSGKQIECPRCGKAAPDDGSPQACAACGHAMVPLSWQVRPDLIGSGPDDADFVVEIDNTGRASLRFGDGDLGRRPALGARFTAVYRVGIGRRGNVGAEAIAVAVTKNPLRGVKIIPRNPMPARGGQEPEPIEEVKARAPGAARADLQRAVVAEDYARIAETRPARPGDARKPRVQRAAASLRWTGSHYEVLVAIDPLGEPEADPQLLADVERLLSRYRRIGHDVRVVKARYVPLYIEMNVCLEPHALRSRVEAALLDAFGARELPGGGRGFFHPDNVTFGGGVYTSRLVSVAQAVEGVRSVEITRLERAFEGPNGEIASGVLPLGPLEIERLDNDPANPENGVLVLHMRGGR